METGRKRTGNQTVTGKFRKRLTGFRANFNPPHECTRYIDGLERQV
jgi:hypothetical protein